MKHASHLLLTVFLLFVVFALRAHDIHDESLTPRVWHLNNGKTLTATLVYVEHDSVCFRSVNGVLMKSATQDFIPSEAQWLGEQQLEALRLNAPLRGKHSLIVQESAPWRMILICLLLAFIAVLFFGFPSVREGIQMRVLMIILPVGLVYSFTKKEHRLLEVNTDPAVVDEAFQPFVPHVHTFFDTDYFYVESHGIPATHEMMVGISDHGWQRQVPIPQCYIGDNAWPIPLNPSMAENPIPVDETHFTRGAIAIAVNGVPIFNVHTNTGVDSYIDGQLDSYGGHCGRADDYHYHIAPLHLYNYTSSSLPIAYGLDGFAVYGSNEPDGSAMLPLDGNHGHYGTDGVYHYHGTAEAPYMIAQMAGNVTEDNTHQLVPQAQAHPVRPGFTPLSGALITDCTENSAGNGYTLSYTLNGANDSIVYSWTGAGVYTFNYYNGVSDSSHTYNGFVPCEIPLNLTNISSASKGLIYPNPALDVVRISLNAGKYEIYDLTGKWCSSGSVHNGEISVQALHTGTYIMQVNGRYYGKFIVVK